METNLISMAFFKRIFEPAPLLTICVAGVIGLTFVYSAFSPPKFIGVINFNIPTESAVLISTSDLEVKQARAQKISTPEFVITYEDLSKKFVDALLVPETFSDAFAVTNQSEQIHEFNLQDFKVSPVAAGNSLTIYMRSPDSDIAEKILQTATLLAYESAKDDIHSEIQSFLKRKNSNFEASILAEEEDLNARKRDELFEHELEKRLIQREIERLKLQLSIIANPDFLNSEIAVKIPPGSFNEIIATYTLKLLSALEVRKNDLVYLETMQNEDVFAQNKKIASIRIKIQNLEQAQAQYVKFKTYALSPKSMPSLIELKQGMIWKKNNWRKVDHTGLQIVIGGLLGFFIGFLILTLKAKNLLFWSRQSWPLK